MSTLSQNQDDGNNENMDTISTSPRGVPSINKIAASSNTPPPPRSNNAQNGLPPSPTPKPPTFLQRVWKKLGINGVVFMIMVKPAIAAVISMAIYQRPSVAINYLNFGYLMIIISIITVPILPRGKFLMNLFLCLVSLILFRRIPLFSKPSFLLSNMMLTKFHIVLNMFRSWNGVFGTVLCN